MIDLDFAAIGERIGRYRRLNGLTASQLADAAGAGLTRSIVANLESGRRNDVGVQQLLSIAWALNVPPSALLVDVLRGDEVAVDGEHVPIGQFLDWLHGWRDEPAAGRPSGLAQAPRTPAGHLVNEVLQVRAAHERETQLLGVLEERHRDADPSDMPISGAPKDLQDARRRLRLLEQMLSDRQAKLDGSDA